MKHLKLFAAGTVFLFAPTLAMALQPSPAGRVINRILNRQDSVDQNYESKQERKRAKDLRKQQHQTDKAVRKAEHERQKELRQVAHERDDD